MKLSHLLACSILKFWEWEGLLDSLYNFQRSPLNLPDLWQITTPDFKKPMYNNVNKSSQLLSYVSRNVLSMFIKISGNPNSLWDSQCLSHIIYSHFT
jgi:hypothetical protein